MGCLAKRYANKRVRQNNDIPNGSKYKLLYPTWRIWDWRIKNFFWDGGYKKWMK